MPVLQDMGVHEERLAGAGRALKGDGPQVVERVIRHVPRQPVCGPCLVQVGAECFRVVEISVQVTFGEQQSEVLIRLPDATLLSGHAQPVAMRDNVGVVFGQFIGPDRGGRRKIQCANVFTLTTGIEAGRNIAQPVQHGAHILIAKFPAHEAVQGKAVLKEGGPDQATTWRHQRGSGSMSFMISRTSTISPTENFAMPDFPPTYSSQPPDCFR